VDKVMNELHKGQGMPLSAKRLAASKKSCSLG
jgi:hypothetical protein